MKMMEQEKYDEIKFLNSILRSIRNMNQMIVREKDPEKLIRKACEILIEAEGFHTVWFRVIDENDKNKSDDQQCMYFDFEGNDIEISQDKADKKE